MAIHDWNNNGKEDVYDYLVNEKLSQQLSEEDDRENRGKKLNNVRKGI